ncbi:recombinase family protein [Limnohabitans sp.]
MIGLDKPSKKRIRCAVYTRKSSEEGLDQEYNSIDAQKDAGEAFIKSQFHEGWIPVADDYDDPAYSGGNMDRPALKRLLADIQAGKVDIVVVYKIDRLTRSLTDFSSMVRVFDDMNVSFVSVTQQFNTSTSMGRLTLNMLLSFAQFEREVTGERIRDKIAASKRKGMWMGGVPPLGYDVVDRKLVVNKQEAALVRRFFTDLPRVKSMTMLVQQLRMEGVQTKSWVAQTGNDRVGKLIDKSSLYKIVNNPTYYGVVQFKGELYPGEHEPIITKEQWDTVQAKLAESPHGVKKGQRISLQPALLKGLITTPDGRSLTPTASAAKNVRRYHYYVSTRDIHEGAGASPIPMLPAAEIEAAVMVHVRAFLTSPQIPALVKRELEQIDDESTRDMTTEQISIALTQIEAVWNQLFPLEQHRIATLIISGVVVRPHSLDVTLHPGGITRLVTDRFLHAVASNQPLKPTTRQEAA